MIDERVKNADRFKGFADIYDKARPKMPDYPIKTICRYLNRKPDVVVDLGCGTGLSALAWESESNFVIGIEPSEDMLLIAESKSSDKVRFIRAFSDDTGLDDECADVVVCSQSFHWMEPTATLKEVNRILKPNGVFATIDCDWPPITKREAEMAYMSLYNKVKEIEKNSDAIKNAFVRYSKDKHLTNIQESGYFRYAREILFTNTEQCSAERFVDLLLSQGSMQEVLKKHPQLIQNDVDEFKEYIQKLFGKQHFEIDFCYKMRVGIK